MYLTQIVTVINDSIGSKLMSKDVAVSIHGVSKQMPRTSNQGDDEIPAYVDDKGEGSFNALDDRFALCVYHKCESMTWSEEIELDFGDGADFSIQTMQMAMFFWGDRTKLHMTQELLTSILASSMPSSLDNNFKLDKAGLLSGSISSVSSPNDSQASWRREFVNIPYALKPEHIFNQINYTIQTVIQKSCIEICADC